MACAPIRVRVRRLSKRGPLCQLSVLVALPLHTSMGKKSRRPKKWFGRGGHQRYAGRPSEFGQECGNEFETRVVRHYRELLNDRARAPPASGPEASEDEEEDEDADEEFSREQRRARKHPERFTRDQLEALNLLPSASERISVAVAVAKAAAKTIPPNQYLSANKRFTTALLALREAIVIDKDDADNFDEYVDSRWYNERSPNRIVKILMTWPRLRKYWPQLRRRICSYCLKGNIDFPFVSKPRLLVCGGCGEGRGVGRYCSEACQREHWPEHQKVCMKFHDYTGKAHEFVETKMHRKVMQGYLKEGRAAGVTHDHILKAAMRMEFNEALATAVRAHGLGQTSKIML